MAFRTENARSYRDGLELSLLATNLAEAGSSWRSMTLGTIVAETARSRWDRRLTSATFQRMKTALAFLSVFNPDEFDHAMDVAQSGVRTAQ